MPAHPLFRGLSSLLFTKKPLLPPLPSHSLIHAASLSVKPSPAPRLHRNAINKIPPGQRPLSHPPLPPPSASDHDLSRMSYIVRRTPNQGLPIYRSWKSGGTRQVVLLKKIDGDRRRLVDDLVEAVGVSRDDIRINATTQHIELKGDYLEKTRDWLLQKGF